MKENVARLLFQVYFCIESESKIFFVDFQVANSTIGGCTLFYQTAMNNDSKTISLLEEDWDYIVLQDYSALPTVAAGACIAMRGGSSVDEWESCCCNSQGQLSTHWTSNRLQHPLHRLVRSKNKTITN